MPELPEVEVVRRGLVDHVIGRTVAGVRVLHPRAVRRHVWGESDFIGRLLGRTLSAARRRGKYLWVELDEPCPGADTLLVHLGMSGQLLITPDSAGDGRHLRVLIEFADGGPGLRFVDQRTFGGLFIAELDATATLPRPISHIARDPMDPAFDLHLAVAALRRRRTEVKRALLDQTVVSGIGNIYADEALWRARTHGASATEAMDEARAGRVLTEASAVMAEALRVGGTSFDALYVNVNGQSGYFDRSLNVYGRADRPCPRCDTPIRREPFMNRSSFFCPRCQPRPR